MILKSWLRVGGILCAKVMLGSVTIRLELEYSGGMDRLEVEGFLESKVYKMQRLKPEMQERFKKDHNIRSYNFVRKENKTEWKKY